MEEKSATKFVGLSLTEVEDSYPNIRILVEDDECYGVTADWVPSRLNVEVKHGMVVGASWG
jgi:hypothetical protein